MKFATSINGQPHNMKTQKVDVYFNLHKQKLSIRDRKTGLVIEHVDSVVLDDVSFVVREAGRQRVLEQRRKNVHAFVRGTLSTKTLNNPIKITYNPYKYSTFVEADTLSPVHQAKQVEIVGKNIYSLS